METCLIKHCPKALLRFLPNKPTTIPHSSMPIHSVSMLVKKTSYDALLLDAGGTLLQTVKPVEETYATIGRKYGLNLTLNEVKQGFRRAFAAPWTEKLRCQVGQPIYSSEVGSLDEQDERALLNVWCLMKQNLVLSPFLDSRSLILTRFLARREGDGRDFWRFVVTEATGSANNDYFEELYQHFANGDAWRLPDGAYETICCLKDAKVKLAIVSNFDSRLRKLLKDLEVADLFDAIIISSEVKYEKPAAEIFKAALDQISVEAGKAVHVGDDLKADKMGANAVGIDCWLWGSDVQTFAEIRDRILVSDPKT